MASLQEVLGHEAAHVPQPDERDLRHGRRDET